MPTLTSSEILLSLLRSALAGPSERPDLSCVTADQWKEVIDLSFDQGVDAISVDGYNRSLGPLPPPSPQGRELNSLSNDSGDDREGSKIILETEELEDLKFEWFGSVLQAEEDYRRQWAAAERMAGIFASGGIDTYVLKGFSLAALYPQPSHRVCCDCDVHLLYADGTSAWEKGNSLMEREGVTVDRSFYKNSTFHYRELMVENHHFCSSVRGGSRRKAYERYLRSIISEGASPLGSSGLRAPGPLFTALLTTSHALTHFVTEGGITLRHVIDWSLALENLSRSCGEQGLRTYEEKCREFGLWKFASALRNRDERLLGEILHPSVPQVECSQGWKTRRQMLRTMLRSRWKYRLYTDTNFAAELFWMVWGFVFEKEPEV